MTAADDDAYIAVPARRVQPKTLASRGVLGGAHPRRSKTPYLIKARGFFHDFSAN
jgi:hypothetical protein